MIPKYDEYRKTHGSGFAKGTLSRKHYSTILEGTTDLPLEEIKKIIAKVEVKLAEKRAKESKKKGPKIDTRSTKPQKIKPQPLKARITPLKKASVKYSDDVVPRSEYLKLETEFKEVKKRYENRELTLLELASDLWKASGRNLSGEDFRKFETRLQGFGINTRIQDSMNIQSTVSFFAPTPSSVINPADIIDGSAGSGDAPSILSHSAGAVAIPSNPAFLREPPPNFITTVGYATDSAHFLPNPPTADITTHSGSDLGGVTLGIVSWDSDANSMNPIVQDNGRPASAVVDSNMLEEVDRKWSTGSMELARKKNVRWESPLEEVPFKLFDAGSDEYQRDIYEDSPCMTTPPFFEW